MALVKCKECGKQISSDTKSCPNCGKRRTKGATKGCAVLMVLLLFVFIISLWETSKKPAAPTQEAEVLSSEQTELVNEALDFAIDNGVIDRVECRERGGNLWIRPAFYGTNFQNKELIATMAYHYCFPEGAAGQHRVIQLIDNQSGNEVGSFSNARGLKMSK